jgi:hypothetical protein
MKRPALSFLFPALFVLASCASEDPGDSEPVDTAELAANPTVTRYLPLHWIYGPKDWIVDPAIGTVRSATPCGEPETSDRIIGIEVDPTVVPDGARITTYRVFVAPCAKNRKINSLPDNRPGIGMRLIDVFGNISSSAWGGGDASTAAGYLNPHDILAPQQPNVPFYVDRRCCRLVLIFENEYGEDAMGGMKITSAEVTFEPPP